MDKRVNIALIGEVLVDVALTPYGYENKLRFGGIFHAARTLWALNIDYDLFYFAPEYLKMSIENYAIGHGAKSVTQIGFVNGAPNIILIDDATESGNQGYDLLLRDEYNCTIDLTKLHKAIRDRNFSDVVIFPGGYDLGGILAICKEIESKIHIDIAYNVVNLNRLDVLEKKFETIFLSTSSELFLIQYQENLHSLKKDLLKSYCHRFVFKENRGGTRIFESSQEDAPIYIDSQTRPIVHSVGVGDCFNLAAVSLKHTIPVKPAFTYASWIAAEYASTTYIDDFKRECHRILAMEPEKIVSISGVSIPWEERSSFNIYIAAPDFDYINKTKIELIVDKLKYHNFVPRLPVREHGQLKMKATKDEKLNLLNKDMQLIKECKMVLAVLIGDDPGTLIEIGFAAALKIPVIVYDPYCRAHNLMLTELPQLVSSNIDSIIAEVFTLASRAKR